MGALLVNQLFAGLVSGAILVLLALGLALIFGHLRLVNFAHGAFYMLGAYAGYEVWRFLGSFWPTLVLVPIVVGLLGVLVERTLIKRLYGRSLQDLLLLTYGLSFVIVELVKIRYGSAGRPFNIPQTLAGVYVLGDVVLPYYLLFTALASAMTVGLLYLFLERTDIGLIIRAGSKDDVMVRALGINFDRTRMLVFGIGIGLAGLAGLLTAPRMGVNPEMGFAVMIFALVTVVVGGLGSFWGAVVGGILIGLIQSLTALLVPELSQLVVFILMGLVLFFRPRGLLGTD
jgi:branched-chain amino acid transport system permease protein